MSTLPPIATTCRSSRTARSCAARRRLLVPTRAPLERASRPDAPHSTSSALTRAGVPSSESPSASSPGTSLAECTARSISPASSAASIVSTQRDLSAGVSPGGAGSQRVRAISAGRDRDELDRVVVACLDRQQLGHVSRPARARARSRGFRSASGHLPAAACGHRGDRASALAAALEVVDLGELGGRDPILLGGLLSAGSSSRNPNSSRTSSRLAWPRASERLRRRIVGSCSSRLITARATASTRARSRGEAASQRPAFSASTCSTSALPCSRSALTVGSTSSWPSQRAKRWISSSTISCARGTSLARVSRLRATTACRSSMSYSVTPSSSPQPGSMSRGTAMSISSRPRRAGGLSSPRSAITSSSSSRPTIG